MPNSLIRKHFFGRPGRRQNEVISSANNAAVLAIVSDKRKAMQGSLDQKGPSFRPEGAVGLTLPIPVRRTIEIGPRGPKVPLLSGWLPPKAVSPISKDDPPGKMRALARVCVHRRLHPIPWILLFVNSSPSPRSGASSYCSNILARAGFESGRCINPSSLTLTIPNSPAPHLRLSPLAAAQRVKATCIA
eukprot:Blabericola_migrator_1__4800@NODE_251_length_10854_cov_130_762121_g212_i0_p7_GENE_NODE_251_length_10854_cov_130_762121_g212_i0NODE_251_length_10854_cov_130_762121_g212_i0_p7_ORF_typecomplete_len189_score9_57_NODE_251_length_10854_cov_130_762121_g212_i011481714